jgi:hypothetical protein
LEIEFPSVILAFRSLIELLFVLVSEFEGKVTQLVIYKRLLAKYNARMRRLGRKDCHIRDISPCSEVLCYILFVRLAEQNYDISLIAGMFPSHSKVNKVQNVELTNTN